MVRQTRRKTGGGWSQGDALSKNAYYVPEYKSYNDCAYSRPGSIQSNPNPELAQTPMAGGSKKNRKQTGGRRSTRSKCRKHKGGCGCMLKGGARKKNGGSRNRRKRVGTCGYYGARGGRYQMDTASSIGGNGPIVAPIYSRIPCESARPMPLNPTMPTLLGNSPNPDVNVSGLKPAFIQAGGAPLSLAYDAPRAGFSFIPNIAQGQPLNPGMIPYNEVVSQQTGCSKTCGASIAHINK
jgi:hypothetical protein